MAGTYPDVPGPMIWWSQDGSIGYTMKISDNSLILLDQAAMNTANAIAPGGLVSNGFGTTTYKGGVVFASNMDLVGMFLQGYNTTGGPWTVTVETSSDCTDLYTGSWSTAGTLTVYNNAVGNEKLCRSGITSVNWTDVKGVRFYYASSGPANGHTLAHFYGTPHAGQNPDRLIFWHPTLDEPLSAAYFDAGDMIPSQAKSPFTYRVKNNSATLTATTVTISPVYATTPSAGALAAQNVTQWSVNGSTWGTGAANRTVAASLAPGAISSVHYMKHTLGATPSLGLSRLELRATAASWA